jgi:hypothetical protein
LNSLVRSTEQGHLMLRNNRKKRPRYRTEFPAPGRFRRWNNFCSLTIE